MATFSSSATTFLIKTDLNWLVGDSFWLFGELGYRMLKTAVQVVAGSYSTAGAEISLNPELPLLSHRFRSLWI